MKFYIELIKPRIALMVVLTAWAGYFLGGGRAEWRLAWLLAGVGLASACTGCLNQCLEKKPDSLMSRTSRRPLPQGLVNPGTALAFGLAAGVLGLALLAFNVNALSFWITALTMSVYLAAYTPLKKWTPLSTWFGSVAGATAPLIGWAAAQGSLALGAWILFAIQFLWQIPHFLAMFWIHREDYRKAGFRVMPVVDSSGLATAFQMTLHTMALVVASLAPVLLGLAGTAYGVAALALGLGLLTLSLKAGWSLSTVDMRRLFFGTLVYLPVVFGLLVVSGVSSSASKITAESGPAAYLQVPDFELRDSSGHVVRRQDFSSPWIANFIFTRCANQCPIMTSRLKALSGQLPPEVKIVSFSVDPYDTPEVLGNYSKQRGLNWIFLSGREGEVRRLSYGGFKLPVASGANAEDILHSQSLVLVDQAGRIRGYFDGMDGASLSKLLREAQLLVQDSNVQPSDS